MKNSDYVILIIVAIIIGLLIVLGMRYKEGHSTELSSNPLTTETKKFIKQTVQNHIRKHLSKGEKYIELNWKLMNYTSNSGETIHINKGTFDNLPSFSNCNRLGISHTFIIVNERGCESHYCKHIGIDKQGNITDYINDANGEDFTGIEFITGLEQGPLRNSNNEELIIWGEDIIRNYIFNHIKNSQQYIPIKWILYTKLTLDEKVFDAIDITFSPTKPINHFHPDWKHAALCIEHKYCITEVNGDMKTKHSVFIISPKGKVKEVSYSLFTISKSAREQYELLFTNFR